MKPTELGTELAVDRNLNTVANRGILASGEQGASVPSSPPVADTVNRRVHMSVAFTFVCECRFCRVFGAISRQKLI